MIRMRDMDPLKGHYTKLRTTHHHTMLLRLRGAWCKSPNKRIFSYKKYALQRTGCQSIETTVRTRKLLWSGALVGMDDHRLPKRVMPGAGERGETRAVGEGERRDGLRDRGSLAIWHHEGVEHRRTLDPWAWYSTGREGGYTFMAAWVKEEEKASEHRQRKSFFLYFLFSFWFCVHALVAAFFVDVPLLLSCPADHVPD